MRRFIVLAFLVYTLGFPEKPSADIVHSFVNYNKHFAGTKGTFVILDILKNLTVRNDEKQAAVRYSPCSTFDIVVALAGVQSGAVKDQSTLSTAMKKNDTSYFQTIAAVVGAEKMQSFVDSVGYGNKELSGGSTLISPDEQVTFLTKLYTNQLTVDPSTLQVVRSALVKNSNPSKTFSGRSGACRTADTNVAWFVGHLKTRQGEYVFATSMEGGVEVRADRAEAVTRSILEEMQLL